MRLCKCGKEAAASSLDCCYVCEPVKRAYYDEQAAILESDRSVRNSAEYIAEFAKFASMLGGFTFQETIQKSAELTDKKFGIGKNAKCYFYMDTMPWSEVK